MMPRILQLVLSSVFYTAICLLILQSKTPEIRPVPPQLMEGLVSGSQQGYIEFGNEFSDFKKYFTSKEPVTFLMDVPFTPYARTIAQYYTAQSYFVPAILNPEPEEKMALVYCSDRFIAEQRMRETGYRLVAAESDGKGVAVKIEMPAPT